MTRARRRGGRTLAAVAVLAAAASAAALVLIRGHGYSGGTRPGHRAPASAPATRQAEVGSRLPQVSLAGLEWRDYHGVRLPSSPSAGPRDTGGGLASGYSDSPLGALLAALNIGVRANAQWGPAVFGPTIRDQVTGPDAGALLSGCQSTYSQDSKAAHITGGRPLGEVSVTEEAFRWVSWTVSAATIDLVSAGEGSEGQTVRAVVQVQVTWDGSDWKLIAPPGGDWGNSAAELNSLSGYTIFPGQG